MPEDAVLTSRGHVFTLRSINDALDREYPGARLVLEVTRDGKLMRARIGSPDGSNLIDVSTLALRDLAAVRAKYVPPKSDSKFLTRVDEGAGCVLPLPGGDPEC